MPRIKYYQAILDFFQNRVFFSSAKHVCFEVGSLQLMNVQLANVVDDIMGLTGLKIIRAITAGELPQE